MEMQQTGTKQRVRRSSWLLLGGMLVGLVAACSGPQPDTVGSSEALHAATIDPFFADIADDEPGGAVAVLQDGDLVYAQGYGLADLETGRPITPQTIFHIGSVGKMMTAYVIMLLSESGHLTYDDPITRFLPELMGPGDHVTIRHLLQHTGGIPDYEDDLLDAFPDQMPTNADALEILADDMDLLFTPGDQFAYSNAGYELLGTIIERVSDQPFPDVLHERLFAPLEMTRTFSLPTNPERLTDPQRARGYEVESGTFELYDADPLDHLVGSGSIYSTVEDLARFDRELDAPTLLSPTTLAEAFEPAHLRDGSREPYGFGWELGTYADLPFIGHSGGWQGFLSYYGRFPSAGLTIVVLSNRTDLDPEALVFDLADLALAEWGDDDGEGRNP
jgi:CubicO group peptidase (beta-lactamase class C family)